MSSLSQPPLLGPSLILTVGAVVSTFQVNVASALFPAASVAVAVKVCEPSPRPDKTPPQSACAVPSKSQVVLARPEPSSLDVTVMSAASLLLGSAGVSEIATDGAVVSTTHV